MAGVTPMIFGFIRASSSKVLVTWRQVARVRLYAFAGLLVEFARCVPDVCRLLRRFESFAFDGVYMKKFRTFHVFQDPECMYQFDDVMTVAGAEVAYVHTFEYVLLVADKRFQRVVETDELLPALFVEPTPVE